MKARFAIALLAVAVLCSSAIAQEQNAKYWYEKGQKLDANQSYEDAVQAYENAIELNPQNSEFFDRKALSLFFLHRNQEATESWKKALQLYNDTLQKNPKNITAWIGKGRAFTMLALADASGRRESYRESELNAYEQGLQITPQNSTMLYFKGSALYELKRYDEAIKACDQALKIGFDPSQPWMVDGVSHLKGLAEAALGKKNESAQSYQEALKGSDEAIRKANSSQNLSEAWAQKGMMLEEQGNYNESVKAFDNATNANPKNEMAWKFKGFMLAHWMGRYREGLAALDRALEIRPAADVWEAKGRVFNELGRYDEAINASEKALSLNQNLTRTWLVKGRALLGTGRYHEALDAYSKAKNTYDEQFFAGRGFALAGLNRSNEAAEAFNNSLNAGQWVLKEDDKSAYGWFWKGEALRGLGRYQEALDAYNLSLENGKDYAISSWRGKGYALDNLALKCGLNDPENFTKTLDAAILAHDKIIKICPNSSDAWSDKGFALGLMGPPNHTKYNESVADYDRAIKLNPKSTKAWLDKGTVLSLWAGSTHNNSLYEDALKAYDQAAMLSPGQTNIRLVKANALLNLGRYNESLRVLDEAFGGASENSEKAQIWFEKAHLFAEQGDYNETVKALEKASGLTPEDKNLWINGGVLLSAILGRYDEALRYYERAIQIDPADGYAWRAKGEALKALGRQAEADAAFAKAKELGYQG